MSDSSANLGLPFILASQAQKHITHNEALQRLDALVQLILSSVGGTTPPVSPATGETHAIGDTPTGAWTGQNGMLASWDGSAWAFCTPQPGWRGWDATNDQLLVWDGATWVPALVPDNLDHLGINTTGDATNRLAVASDAALFTHAGTDHRIKVNKAADTHTSSLLFQSDFTGHAEIGLAGTTDMSIKVSSDGAGWLEALVIDAATGLPSGEMIQGSPTDTTSGRLARADYAYSPGNLLGIVEQSSGVPTGAVIEHGSNSNGCYTRFADGTQICWIAYGPNMNANFADGNVFRTGLPQTWTFPAAFLNTNMSISATADLGARWVTAKINSAASCNLAQFSAASSATLVNTRAFAIGRWA